MSFELLRQVRQMAQLPSKSLRAKLRSLRDLSDYLREQAASLETDDQTPEPEPPADAPLADVARASASVRDSRRLYERHIAARNAAMEKAHDAGHDYATIARHARLSRDRTRVTIEAGRRKRS